MPVRRVVSRLTSATDLLELIGGADLLVPDDDDGSVEPDVVLGPPGGTAAGGAVHLGFDPRTIEDVFDDVIRLGAAVGRERAAAEAVVELRARYWTAVDYVNPYVDGPVIAVVEAAEPLTVAGRWTPGFVEHAGGRFPLNEVGAPPRVIEPELLVESMPDRLVVERDLVDALRSTRWWSVLPAVQDGHVVAIDGRVLSQPGPRLVDAFRWLVSWINDRPEVGPPAFPAESVAAVDSAADPSTG